MLRYFYVYPPLSDHLVVQGLRKIWQLLTFWLLTLSPLKCQGT